MCKRINSNVVGSRTDGQYIPAVFSLDGDDWTVTGLWRNQTEFSRAFAGKVIDLDSPAVPPVPATVPGAVNADLMRTGFIPDYNVGWGSLGHEWVEHREWVYTKRFIFPDKGASETHVLCFDGLDYEGEIFLNGHVLRSFRGTCLPVEADVTDLLVRGGENTLQVLFYPAPEVDGMYGHTSQGRHLKARFSYLWDWCARVVPVGIWDHVSIKSRGPVYLEDVHARGDYTDGYALLHLTCAVCGLHAPGRLDVSVCPHGVGEPVFTHSFDLDGTLKLNETFPVVGTQPWQPNGCGDARLYDVRMILRSGGEVLHVEHRRVGFRHVQLGPNPGAPAGTPPYTLVVNGRRVFIKGVNWVPATMLFGCTTREDYFALLGRFRDMNCNLLRVWGGGIVEKREFYEACDELGLMVWQELMQSSSAIENCPPDDEGMLRELVEVASWAMRQRGDHPSHVIWCGGNELTASKDRGIPATLDHPNLKKLSGLAAELDPGKPFLPCSPFGPDFFGDVAKYGEGNQYDVHGRWHYAPDHYHYYNMDDGLLRSEVGTAALNSARTLRKTAGGLNPWPPTPDNPFWIHHGAWWNQWELLTNLYGPWDENDDQLDAFSMASQYVQLESLRYALESIRRREPLCGGAIVWMGNEPFANAANTSLLEFNGRPKSAYYAARRAFAPIHMSCNYKKLDYSPGEEFLAGVFLHDDGERTGKLYAEICGADGKTFRKWTWYASQTGNPARLVGEVRWAVPNEYYGVFFLRLRMWDGEELLCCENTYLFTAGDKRTLRPLRTLSQTQLGFSVRTEGKWSRSTVMNVGKTPAVMVMVEAEDDPLAIVSDGGLVLYPGESVELTINKKSGSRLSAFALNAQRVSVEMPL